VYGSGRGYTYDHQARETAYNKQRDMQKLVERVQEMLKEGHVFYVGIVQITSIELTENYTAIARSGNMPVTIKAYTLRYYKLTSQIY